jgi:hypothetical protein
MTEETIRAIAILAGLGAVVVAILLKVGLWKLGAYTALCLLLIVGLLYASGGVSNGAPAAKTGAQQQRHPPHRTKDERIVPEKEEKPRNIGLTKMTSKQQIEAKRKLELVAGDKKGVTKYSLIEADKVLDFVLSIALSKIMNDDDFRPTVGEKVKKIRTYLEADRSLAPSTLRVLRQLSEARTVRNRVAHEGEFAPTSSVISKSLLQYNYFMTAFLSEMGE